MADKDFISTRDVNEAAKIHSSDEYFLWNYEYVDGEYCFYSPSYKKKETPKSKVAQEVELVTLEQLEPLLSEPGYICYGHGTGRSGNSDEVVDLIFNKGLRTKDNSLYFTTIGLSTPTPELKEQSKELGLPEPTIEGLRHNFNHWQHQDSKKIIIARLPIEYINEIGDRSDRDGEMFGAFYTEEIQANEKSTNYLDPKFIIGCFDVEKQMVKLNKSFERSLSEATRQQLQEGYKKAIEKTKKRIESSKQIFVPEDNPTSKITYENNSPQNMPFDLESFDFDDEIDWGLDSEGKGGRSL